MKKLLEAVGKLCDIQTDSIAEIGEIVGALEVLGLTCPAETLSPFCDAMYRGLRKVEAALSDAVGEKANRPLLAEQMVRVEATKRAASRDPDYTVTMGQALHWQLEGTSLYDALVTAAWKKTWRTTYAHYRDMIMVVTIRGDSFECHMRRESDAEG